MGKLIFNDLARIVSLVAATYGVWAAIWGIFFRKFMFDMIGATLGPAGLIPPSSSDFFIAVIVKAPVVQILSIVFGLFTLILEWPVEPIVSRMLFLHRSALFRVLLYVWNGFLSIILYQGVNAGIFYLVAACFYAKAMANKETIKGPPVHISLR